MPIHYETAVDHTVVITIDRPEAKNALDLYHFRDLAAAWRRFADDDDVWLAIITGVGRNFMSGADLKTYIPQITELHDEIGKGGGRRDRRLQAARRHRRRVAGHKIYKPIIAAVNGPCVAGGWRCSGASTSASPPPTPRFGVMEPKRGLFAGGGTTVRLPRQLAFPAAMEFLLTAEAFPAERALELGLLNEIVRPRTAAGPAAAWWARRIIANAPARRAGDQGERPAGPGHATLDEAYVIEQELSQRCLRHRGRQGGPQGLRREAPAGWQGK